TSALTRRKSPMAYVSDACKRPLWRSNSWRTLVLQRNAPPPSIASYLTRGDRRGQAWHTHRSQKRRSCDLVVPVRLQTLQLASSSSGGQSSHGKEVALDCATNRIPSRTRSPTLAHAGSGERPYAPDLATR